MLQQTTTQSSERRFLRRAEVEAKAGFKRAHIYALMKDGKFPKAVRLGGQGCCLGSAVDRRPSSGPHPCIA